MASPFSFGAGLLVLDVPGRPSLVSVDHSTIPYRVAPPASSAPADPSLGSGAWAADSEYFYCLVHPLAGLGGETLPTMVWARMRLEIGWDRIGWWNRGAT